MSCRHDLANGTCRECYPQTGTITPEGPGDSMDGPGAVPRIGAAALEASILTNTIQIGRGCHHVDAIQSGDILFASSPDEAGNYTSLRLTKTGEIWFNGKLIGADEAMQPIVETMRRVFTRICGSDADDW
jgi:hypothetical protein